MIPTKYIRLILAPKNEPGSGASSQNQRNLLLTCNPKPVSSSNPTGSIHPSNLKYTISPMPLSLPPRRIHISMPANSPTDSTELCATKIIETMTSAGTGEEASKQLLSRDKQKSNTTTCEEIISIVTSTKNAKSNATDSSASSSNTNGEVVRSGEVKKKRSLKRLLSQIKQEDSDSNVFKRSKNWSEEETIVFIGVWAEYYPELMSAGKRNTPTYDKMVNEISALLPTRSLTSTDVKLKIGNLTSEYRKRKREQGKTGASPCPWKYYDQVDKILGERPYNDDSLLSDSMITEQEKLASDNDISFLFDLPSTQTSEQANDSVGSGFNLDPLITPMQNSTSNSPSISNDMSMSKTSTPARISAIVKKKNTIKKKKRCSEIKVDLMQQVLTKMESANETAAQYEVKMIDLLEKQTQLQQQSVNNEQEFLQLFKVIVNNTTSKT